MHNNLRSIFPGLDTCSFVVSGLADLDVTPPTSLVGHFRVVDTIGQP